MPGKKVVLAYSGGLDTSVAIRWLKDQGWDVIAFTVDLGEKRDLDAIQADLIKRGVEFCVGSYVDVHGVTKAKIVPADCFASMCRGSEPSCLLN